LKGEVIKMPKSFNDRIQVYSTKAGTQYVRPSDVIMSEQYEKESKLIKELFKESHCDTPAAYVLKEKLVPVIETMTVEYKCGCVVSCGGLFEPQDASLTCDKHGEELKRVVRTTEYR
jgi:hypothetical protein